MPNNKIVKESDDKMITKKLTFAQAKKKYPEDFVNANSNGHKPQQFYETSNRGQEWCTYKLKT